MQALHHNESIQHFYTVKTTILYFIQEPSSYSIFGLSVFTVMYHYVQPKHKN